MPENPDITVYIERLEEFVSGQPLEQIRFASHIFLRSAEPPIKSIHGAVVHGVNRYATNETNYCPSAKPEVSCWRSGQCHVG